LRHYPASGLRENRIMVRMRLILLAAAALAAFTGIAAGAASLSAGSIDQALAFTWPGLAAAVALALIAPARSGD
jgi:hypothetical protein